MASGFLIDLIRNKVELDSLRKVSFDVAALEPSTRGAVIELLSSQRTLSEQSLEFLERVAASNKEVPALRARALKALVRQQHRSADRVMAAIGQDETPSPEMLDLWRDYLRDGRHANRVAEFRAMAEGRDPALRALGFAVLLAIDANPRAAANAKAQAARAIEAGWKTPGTSVSLLQAIGRTDAIKYALQVRNHLSDSRPDVKAAALVAARRLDEDKEGDSAAHGPTISSMQLDSVITAAGAEHGNVRSGERLFQRQGCAACHTVSPGEAPKGPSLAGIATRYKRAELIESILKPSARIAQGFEPQKIALADGRTVEGFVVRESGDEVELRDGQGIATVIPKKDIDVRAKGEISIMPAGLADSLTVPDLVSLLAYLESLKSQ